MLQQRIATMLQLKRAESTGIVTRVRKKPNNASSFLGAKTDAGVVRDIRIKSPLY